MSEEIKRIEVGIRITEFRDSINVTQRAVSEEIGIAYQSVNKIEKGGLRINEDYTRWLYEKGINLNWLFFGDGNMLRHERIDGENLSEFTSSIDGKLDKSLDILLQLKKRLID